MIWCAASLLAMFLAALPNYRQLARWSYLALAVNVAMLLIVFVQPPVNGAHRWIRLASVGIQPSELAKVALVVALARWLTHRDNRRGFSALAVPLAMTCVPVVLILREPDLGTALVFLPVMAAMLYVGGTRRRDLAALVLSGVVLAPILWTQMSAEQRSRVTSLFAQAQPGERPQSDGYQLYQSKQLLALGGVWGSYWAGETADDRAAYHLPESQTDFIFSVVGERYGWFGLTAVLGLYAVLVMGSLAVAQATREPFGRLVAAGVAALFATQVVVNAAMTVGLLPVTGLSLPLVSYGGSGMLAHGIALGLVLNVAMRPGYEVYGTMS